MAINISYCPSRSCTACAQMKAISVILFRSVADCKLLNIINALVFALLPQAADEGVEGAGQSHNHERNVE